MGVRDILNQFVGLCTTVDKTVTSGGFIVPNAPPGIYGPGVGSRLNAGLYVDTGQYAMGNAGDRLWTDRASWCMIVASFDPAAHRSYLAHITPGQSQVGPGGMLLAYSQAVPANLTLCTMETYLDAALSSDAAASKSSLWSVVKMLDYAYQNANVGGLRGAMVAASHTTIVTGYRGIDWDVYCGVAVEDYGVFVMSPQSEDWSEILLWHNPAAKPD